MCVSKRTPSPNRVHCLRYSLRLHSAVHGAGQSQRNLQQKFKGGVMLNDWNYYWYCSHRQANLFKNTLKLRRWVHVKDWTRDAANQATAEK